MTLPFPHVSYQRYKNTFLNTVVLSLKFAKVTMPDEEFYSLFSEYVKAYFGIDVPKDEFNHGAAISKEDASVTVNLTDSNVMIIFRGQKYESFSQSILPHVFGLRNYFKNVVKMDRVNGITIRKINVWSFRNEKNVTITSESAKQAVFSTELLHALSSDNLSEEEKLLNDCKKCEWHEGDETFVIRSAFNDANNKRNLYQLILDTEYTIKKEGGFEVETIANDLLDYNSELYYAYHWCINDTVLSFMNKDIEK